MYGYCIRDRSKEDCLCLCLCLCLCQWLCTCLGPTTPHTVPLGTKGSERMTRYRHIVHSHYIWSHQIRLNLFSMLPAAKDWVLWILIPPRVLWILIPHRVLWTVSSWRFHRYLCCILNAALYCATILHCAQQSHGSNALAHSSTFTLRAAIRCEEGS